MALDTHRTETTHLAENKRSALTTIQYLLEAQSNGVKIDFNHSTLNNLQVLICGEESFAKIAEDIENAKSSIDIICWGFDPAMELRRSATNWPRGHMGGMGNTYGELLKAAVARGVNVRLLAWYGRIANTLNAMTGSPSNLPGLNAMTTDQRARIITSMDIGVDIGIYPIAQQERYKSVLANIRTQKGWQRKDYNAQWFQDVQNNKIVGKNGANLVMHTRDIKTADAQAAMNSADGSRGLDFVENKALSVVATYHQKTILIDYKHENGAHAVGYVMGLNSVTDYWDTADHVFEDKRRGEIHEGADDDSGLKQLKPFQDYVCRVRGEALFAVNRNFANAWANGVNCGKAVCESPEGQLHPKKLGAEVKAPYHTAQIVRTQPAADGGEAATWALYKQASIQAMRYIYVENQYFQYTDWAQLIIDNRKKYVSDYKNSIAAANKKIADYKGKPLDPAAPDLHIFIVTPSPERAGMVPRTNDTINTLGVANSMPNQDKQNDEAVARYNKEYKEYERQKKEFDTYWASHGNQYNPYDYESPAYPIPPILAPDVAESQKIRKNGMTVAGQGIKTLVVNLWTQDRDYHSEHWNKPSLSLWDKAKHPTKAGQEEVIKERIAKAYREIYIHSKLMMIDDAMFTLGSANLNFRSMHTDAEINIATNDPALTKDLRKRVWRLHTTANGQDVEAIKSNPEFKSDKLLNNVSVESVMGGDASKEEIAHAFEQWQAIAQKNLLYKDSLKPIYGNIVKFRDLRTSVIRLA